MSDNKLPDAKLHTRCIGAEFTAPIALIGNSEVASVSRNIDSIVAARLDPDLTPWPVDKGQPHTGVLMRRRVHDRTTNRWHIAQQYVPWAQVKHLNYGE